MKRKYGELHLRINEILEEKGISKTRICKDMDIPRSNSVFFLVITKNAWLAIYNVCMMKVIIKNNFYDWQKSYTGIL